MTSLAAGTPNEVARLVSEFDHVAVRIARRYSRSVRADDDLAQVGRLGLVLAAIRYEPDRGPFGPYAAATIAGEIKRHLRDHDWSVRVPRGLQEQALEVARVNAELEQELAQSPTVTEVAERAAMSVEEVLAARRALAARHADDLPPASTPLTEPDLALRVDLERAVGGLDRDDRRLFELHYEQELSQRQIAALTGRSQTDVHRRLRRIVRRIAAEVTE